MLAWAAQNYLQPPGFPIHEPNISETLNAEGVRISMDDRGRWMGNIFIWRLWCTIKYERVHLLELETGSQASQVFGRWVDCDTDDRPHQLLDEATPAKVHVHLEPGSS